MKRILIRSGKSPFHVASQQEFLQKDLIGTNSGNLLFSDAAHKILLTERTEITSNGLSTVPTPERARQINEQYDVFVVPLANAFRPSFKGALDKLTALIEQLIIPVVVVGVGAQASEDYDTTRLTPIESSVKRFVKAVLERSASIGVRGELTASYLDRLGFKQHVEVIGCPSMFLHGDTFPTPRDPGVIDAHSRIAINISPGATTVGDLEGMARHALSRFPHLRYYAQNLADAEILFWGDTSAVTGPKTRFPRRLTHPLFEEDRVRVPLDPRTWMDELATYDFVYGTRIHGNIAPLLAGTPSVVLVHDSRTLELCRYFGIPHRMLSATPADVHPRDLYEQADYSEMLNGHKERFDRFVTFLDKNGLENTFTHGDGGAAFDLRLGALDLPPSLGVWDGSDDGALRYRFSRLHERHNVTDRRIEVLTKKNNELQKKLGAMERRLADLENGSPLRIGPAVRRQVRRRLRPGN
ncbi:polysaccharide pyruvyl transferase family protein [Streptomyces sp. NBC_01716]|uniref:polysaccharide pyruvyl transferase family protein n=1 Tax=Streptomyces sp. NBC_01716 TaxID=2975917 RepID=UPI002E2F940D|nr:polysaccharide pyruvyl transferase family protein [Streptomyces sp. NBC_01716]